MSAITKANRWIHRYPLMFECSLIFLVCCFVYLANNRTISSRDTVPNALLAFNWIFNHQLNFDSFRGNYFYNQPIWFFAESVNGHLTSAYPIGTAIVAFPLYLLFSGILRLNALTHDSLLNIGLYPIDITTALFEPTRLFCEKLAATIITAAAVVIFYLATNLKFNKSVCILLTFTYAFATQTWITSSQALWQHTAANLVVSSILLCLLKANREKSKSRKVLLLITGILCGLITSIRPTDGIFAIAAIVYAIFAYRRKSIYLFLGLPSALFNIAWNLYYFNSSILGGYSNQTGLLSFTVEQFTRSFLGLLVSPSRGFFIFSPVMLFAVPGAIQVFKLRSGRDEKLVLCLTIASVILFFNYCFFTVWWQGWTYGCRFLVDALPILCFLIGYPIAAHFRQVTQGKKKLLNVGFACFLTLILVSTAIETVGAFTLETGKPNWNSIPASVDTKSTVGMDRLWKWRDSFIERSTRAFLHELTGFPTFSAAYMQKINGKIERIHVHNQPSNATVIYGSPGSSILVEADLQNTGNADWLGYESGVGIGTIAVRAKFYDTNDQVVSEERLHVSNTRQGERTQAIGYIGIPVNLGTYRLVFDLVTQGSSVSQTKSSYSLKVDVNSEAQIFSQEFSNVQIPDVIVAGKTVKLFTIVKSHSNFSWLSKVRDFDNKIKYPVSFSYRWLTANGEIEVAEGERTPLPWSTFCNTDYFYDIWNTMGIQAHVKAPDRPGKHLLRLTMVHEGVAWFDQKGAKPKDIPITVIGS